MTSGRVSALVLLWLPALVLAQAGPERVSVGAGGAQASGASYEPALSADGRYVAFRSDATNLVGGDSNGNSDIFVRDRQSGQTTRVSVATGGAQANGSSYELALSADGRYVAFWSDATNLVAGDSNGQKDVFVHDRQSGQTTRVSVATGGAQGRNGGSLSPALSADGRYVAFSSSATNLVAGDSNVSWDIFVHDRQSGQTTRVSVATGGAQASSSFAPALSADGRYVAFRSSASNLVAGDSNGVEDVFVHDRQSGQTTRVSVATGGAQANRGSWMGHQLALSADGRYVAFESDATNLVAGDTNGKSDVFVATCAP